MGATEAFDPTSPDPQRRGAALAYLKSRVDITAALRGDLLAGPILFPYGVFPTTTAGDPLWSDALQDWLAPRYRAALPVLEALADHAEGRGVRLAIEPVDHWETPGPNMVGEIVAFLDGSVNRTLGLCVDSAHVVLGSDGPDAVRADLARAIARGRLHSVHVSAPDRGAVHDSWIPWRAFLEPIAPHYAGPYLVEVFNAVPPFPASLRQTRRRFWIPGEDPAGPGPSAYDVAGAALATLRAELKRCCA